ncbi:Dolichyl-diphosphooligosaccharide--protein glycosyltransferase subunit wbp1 [Fonsecaea pedrosoi]|nr:Dolichyl-diphosphooligosaccharide--protein glycosyltransferase subunit wbp1 [Fonsecaea pedrosoi]
MRLFSSACLLLLPLLSAVLAKSAVGDRVLVVLEDESQKGLYSQFWADLEGRDYKLSFQSPRSEDLSLFRHGQLAYDHLLLTPPKSKGYGPALTPKILLDYVNAGGNVLLGLSSDAGTPSAISSLLLEFDISLSPDKSSVVVDHFNYDTVSAAEKHDVLLVERPGQLRPDVVNFFGGDGTLAVPKAVGQTLGNTSPLLAPILKAPATAYAYNPKDEAESVEESFATGSQLALVSAMQARNSARFTVLGSLEMLQDKWFDASVKSPNGKSVKTVNQEFAKQLTEWTFQEVGVLKVFHIQHYEVRRSTTAGENTTQISEYDPDIYRIKNDVKFSIEIGQYDRTHYVPFTVPANDALQLEFTMLSPFHRIPLQPSSTTPNSTVFSTTFTTPDQHGIFAFKVNYKRPFLTYIEEKRQVTVRHFAHDEWPRSWAISGAWPWIGGLWSVVLGFVAFVMVWLYCEPPKEEAERRRKLSVSSTPR